MFTSYFVHIHSPQSAPPGLKETFSKLQLFSLFVSVISGTEMILMLSISSQHNK